MTSTGICENQDEALTGYLDALFGAPVEITHAAPTPVPVATSRPASYLCFTISGLRMAMAADAVGPVLKFSERAGAEASPLHLGYVEYNGRLVPVLSGTELVLGKAPDVPYQRIVVEAGGRFALAVHGLDQRLEIAAEDICWKTVATRRRWLAGTYTQKRCALLDIEELAALAAAEDARDPDAMN